MIHNQKGYLKSIVACITFILIFIVSIRITLLIKLRNKLKAGYIVTQILIQKQNAFSFAFLSSFKLGHWSKKNKLS